jgi:hypothetical protein
VGRAADCKNDALQRASFRWGRVLPPPQTPERSAILRGWVGGRSNSHRNHRGLALTSKGLAVRVKNREGYECSGDCERNKGKA